MATAEKILSVKLNASEAINGIKGLNDIIATNKRLLAEMEVQGKKNTQEYHVLAEQTKVLSSEKRTLQKEVRNEIKAQSELDGSLKQMRAQLSNLTKEYDSLSKAERNLGNRGKELKAQINQLTTEIKSAEEGTQRYYRNVGNYQNAILNAIGLNNNFGRSLLGIASSEKTVSGAFSSMGSSIKAFGASLMGLLSNPVFLAIAGIAGVGMAFKWFYDYNEGLAEATRLTREFTGYSGDNLIAMRNKIQATADVMGKEFNDTLKTADALMANFHITGDEAMDIINKGFASGADLNGDMLSKIQQLAPTFHDAGIEADQMVAIISQTRSGIFTEQGLEAIKQGSARIREMSSSTANALKGIGINVNEMQSKLRDGSMTTFDAVKQVSNALKEMPDNAQEVGEVMSAVFGRQGKFASQEMIESLGEMSTSLDEVTAKTGEYGELLLENIDTEEELDNVTSALFDMTDKGWEEAKQKATIYAKKALVAVVKGIIDVTNWFIRLYNQSLAVRAGVQYIILGFKQMWNAGKLVIGLIITGFKNIGRMIEAWVKAFNIAGQAIKGVAEGIAGIFRGIWNMDAEAIEHAVTKIKDSASAGAKGIVSAFGNAWQQGLNDLKGNFSDFVSDSIDNVKTAVGNINGTLNEVSIPAWAGGYGEGGGGTRTGGGNGSSSSGGSGKGGGTGKSGSNKSGGSSGKSDAQKAAEQRAALAKQLIAEANRLQQKALEEEAKTSIEGIEKMYDAQKAAIIERYSALGTLTADEQKAYDALLKNNEDARLQAIGTFKEKQLQEWEKMQKDEHDKATKYAQTVMDATKDGSLEQLKWQLEVMRLQMEAELQMYEDNEEMKTAIREKYNMMALKAQQEYANQQVTIEQEKYTAMAEVSGQLGELAGAFADDSKAAAIASKTLALGQIMISQAVAIANAVRAGSAATNPWQMIAQIAASVTAVTVAMVQAFKSLDDAKFATGGYIQGAGTSTSDSIPIRVSNGESIMNANTTAMFGGLLSSLNQLGGGVPIQVAQTSQSVQGEDMLARAVARGVAMLPAPVVSVADINEGQRRVEVITERAML